MKKFYYKKDSSIDKTPIMLRLERRHTLDVDVNEKEHNQNRISSRTKSVSSVHLLEDKSAISKVKTREITKSLSEDVLNKRQVNKSAKVITETDLSSSWLYKARKDSLNSKDSPLKTLKPTNLSPVALTDPKLKPVPVRSGDRTKKSRSCLYYFGIMMAISFCTIGVLAAITGVLYKEIFSSKNSTSAETSESMIEIVDLIPESISLNDYTETDEYRLINETLQQSSESTESTSNVSKNETSSLYEDQSKESFQTVRFSKLNVTDLSQLVDSRKVEIKFKDSNTIIYELNSSTSSEYSGSANNSEMKESDSNGYETEEINEALTSEDTNTRSGTVIEKREELENLETFINSQSRMVSDIFKNNEQEQHQSAETLNVEELKENYDDSSLKVKFENDYPLESNESEMFNSDDSQSFVTKLDNVFLHNENVSVIPERNDIEEEKLEKSDMSSSKNNRESEPSPDFKNTDKKILSGKSEHDVESMLMIIDEHEEPANTISKRNGEISSIESLSFKPRISSNSFEMKNSADGHVTTQHSEEEKVAIQEAEQMKQLDMKVSLAEAMKHLQVLDVNNKIPASRTKSNKPKTQSTQQTKLRENTLNKQNITIEKLKYLQNLRLMLQENLQRV